MMGFLKDTRLAPVWALLRIWLGIQWLTAGWGKISAGGFDSAGFLKGALGKAVGEHPAVQGWYATFIRDFALPNAKLFNVLVPWGEFLVGVGLIVGALTVAALVAAIFMNLNYMLAGTTSTNPILYTVAVILLAVGPVAYGWGFDGLVMPRVKHFLSRLQIRGGAASSRTGA